MNAEYRDYSPRPKVLELFTKSVFPFQMISDARLDEDRLP